MADLRSLLEEIREERGKLTPKVVVEVARDPNHPLHNRFEWDDSVAAERFRLHQAGELVRSVQVRYRGGEGDLRKVRGYHSIQRENTPEPVYMPVEEIMQDPLTTKILLSTMRRDFESFKARYEHLKEFYDLLREELNRNAA